MRRRWQRAIFCAVGMATITACGSVRDGAHTQTAPQTPNAARATAATSYPVYQLSPGHITVAEARTPQGPIAIALHRIRYYGHVSLCVSESDTNSGSDSSCAKYPIGPTSNQNIGRAPVWWATDYLALCSKSRFQVVSGVLLRPRLTAWLRTPGGVSRMPTVAIPRAFGVAGGLVYATISTEPDAVTLRDARGRTVYAASVAPLTGFPRMGCGSGRSAAGRTSIATASAFVLSSPARPVVP